MPTRLRKTRKMRGSRTHGWGQVGQHRKSGSRGGVGRAGSMGHKFLSFYKEDKDKGFVRKVPRIMGKEVNVGELDELYRKIGIRTPEGDMLIDLNAHGYSKLLGAGEVSSAYVVKVAEYSERARAKIEAAGGKIVKPGEA
ncbi:MAG: 50S ribosomal protein L15 [Crenarchaeota archaeon]|nr:50S ribosomal protein L15 [Thermoproteota archaeon]MDW8033928.1 uL15 family ribosomal protein [Nitrososphaerota archaeon]